MRQETMGAWGWQWHQLDHMQTICTSIQTDNYTNTSSLNFTDWMLFLTPNQQYQSTDKLINNYVVKVKYTLHHLSFRDLNRILEDDKTNRLVTRWSRQRSFIRPVELSVLCNSQTRLLHYWYARRCNAGWSLRRSKAYPACPLGRITYCASEKRTASVWRPSVRLFVCPVGHIVKVAHQGSALTRPETRDDILVTVGGGLTPTAATQARPIRTEGSSLLV